MDYCGDCCSHCNPHRCCDFYQVPRPHDWICFEIAHEVKVLSFLLNPVSCATRSAISQRTQSIDARQYESNTDIVYENNSRHPFDSSDTAKRTVATVKGNNTSSRPRDILEAGDDNPSDEEAAGLFNEELLNVQSSEPDFLRGLQEIEPELLRRKLTVLQTFGDGPKYNTGYS